VTTNPAECDQFFKLGFDSSTKVVLHHNYTVK